VALTKSQWFAKLKRWVPTWFWETENYNSAAFNGVADALSELQTEVDYHIDQTKLLDAEGEYLDQHGSERTITRFTGESDAAYAIRIQNLSNPSNPDDIEAMLDAVIAPGTRYIIREMPVGLMFAKNRCFATRKWVTSGCKYNEFSIVIEPQTQQVYDAISEALQAMKAQGVFCRVIEVPEP
jgi:hypothetical protein